MHGDIFFRILSSKILNTKLVKIVENNGYGESRAIFGEGGITKSYFYLYSIHRRINYTFFEAFIKNNSLLIKGFVDMAMYKKVVCECINCEDLFGNVSFDSFIKLMTTNKSELSKKDQLAYDSNNELIIKHLQFSKRKEDDEISTFNKEQLFIFLEE
ncbi:MAG: hypothetical protein ACRCXQ_05730 [Vagococcus fluvialis]